MGAHIQSSTRNACPWTSGVEALDSLTFVTIHVRFVMKKSPQIEGTFVTLEIDAPGCAAIPVP